MPEPKSKRRLAENEAFFREQNERVQKSLDAINKLAAKNNQQIETPSPNELFYFYCECADENCDQRVQLSLKEYTKIHKRRNCFIIIPGHEVPSVERITRRESKFYIVKKHIHVPEQAPHLQPTPVNNV
jgi:hypothetical protein